MLLTHLVCGLALSLFNSCVQYARVLRKKAGVLAAHFDFTYGKDAGRPRSHDFLREPGFLSGPYTGVSAFLSAQGGPLCMHDAGPWVLVCDGPRLPKLGDAVSRNDDEVRHQCDGCWMACSCSRKPDSLTAAWMNTCVHAMCDAVHSGLRYCAWSC